VGMTLGPMVSGGVARAWGISGVYLTTGGLLVASVAVAGVLLSAPRPSAEEQAAA